MPIPTSGSTTSGGWRDLQSREPKPVLTLPHRDHTAGFFIARLRRR